METPCLWQEARWTFYRIFSLRTWFTFLEYQHQVNSTSMSVGKMNPKYGTAYLSYGGEVVDIFDYTKFTNDSVAIV